MPSRSRAKSRRRRRLRRIHERAQAESEETRPVGESSVQAEETGRVGESSVQAEEERTRVGESSVRAEETGRVGESSVQAEETGRVIVMPWSRAMRSRSRRRRRESEEMMHVGESSVQAEETRHVGESSVQAEETGRVGESSVQAEEMRRAVQSIKKLKENRRRKERRKRSKQLQKQNVELNFPPPPTLTTDTVNPERIIYEPFDFTPFLTLEEDDPARDEYIEQHAGLLDIDSSGHLRLDLMDPDKEFYLIPCLLHPGQPKYYRRLIVNNMCTRKFNYVESEDSDLDRQYVRFYSRLEEGIKDLVPTWAEFLGRCFEEAKNDKENANRLVYEAEASRIAEETEFSKLESSDIYNCIMDLIKEKSLVKDRLELSREFHRCLLECGYGEDKKVSDKYLRWRRGEKHPLSEAYEMLDYKQWLAQPGIRQMEKDEKLTELMKYHDKKLKEDSSTRIRYLKLKLELAERLGLVPKEAGIN